MTQVQTNAVRLKYLLLATLCSAILAACAGEPSSSTSGPQPDAPQAPIDDQPAQDVPPATAPAATEPDTAAPGPESASPTADGDSDARFDGYGDIRFGTAAAEMPKAWGGELNTLGKQENPSCYFMTPKWVKAPAEFNFMIGDDKFVRFGTEGAKMSAPGGGKVGMTKAQIDKLYPGRIEAQPHKYTQGQYLRITDPAGGKGVLIFETDGRTDGAKVTEWRVGIPPQVDNVEGCS